MVMVSLVTECTTPLATSSICRGVAFLLILCCNSCMYTLPMRPFNAACPTPAFGGDIKFPWQANCGDLLGGAASSLSSHSSGYDYVGSSVSLLSSCEMVRSLAGAPFGLGAWKVLLLSSMLFGNLTRWMLFSLLACSCASSMAATRFLAHLNLPLFLPCIIFGFIICIMGAFVAAISDGVAAGGVSRPTSAAGDASCLSWGRG